MKGTYTWPGEQGHYTGPFKNNKRDTTESEEVGTMVWNPGKIGDEHEYVGKFVNGSCTEGTLDGA